jgi:hypothetical protein
MIGVRMARYPGRPRQAPTRPMLNLRDFELEQLSAGGEVVAMVLADERANLVIR